MSTVFHSPFKSPLTLYRYPVMKGDLLQAWDAADDLLLSHLHSMGMEGKKILIVGDQFGALSCALEGFSFTTYSDSFVSAKALEQNSGGRLGAVNQLSDLGGPFDLVIARVPKNSSFFEDTLAHVSGCLKPGGQLICAAMVKYLSAVSFDLIEKYIGETTTSLAVKKARLVFATFSKEKVSSPYPLQVAMEGFDQKFTHHSNLFSREKLDIGTRFFLEHIPRGDFKAILDLGCANGIVGIQAKRINPGAQIVFADESKMAIESARVNYGKFFKDSATYVWGNCYEGQDPDSLDLVLCNPPFHQQTTLGTHIAWQMFSDSRKALRKDGILRVIGNLHLDYPQTMKRVFGNSRVIAQNSKFRVIESIRV